MSRNSSATAYTSRLDRLIEREIHSPTNRRFLNGLPAFKPELSLPDQISALLAQLEQVETNSGKS